MCCTDIVFGDAECRELVSGFVRFPCECSDHLPVNKTKKLTIRFNVLTSIIDKKKKQNKHYKTVDVFSTELKRL